MPALLEKHPFDAGPVATLIGSLSRHKTPTETFAATDRMRQPLKVAPAYRPGLVCDEPCDIIGVHALLDVFSICPQTLALPSPLRQGKP